MFSRRPGALSYQVVCPRLVSLREQEEQDDQKPPNLKPRRNADKKKELEKGRRTSSNGTGEGRKKKEGEQKKLKNPERCGEREREREEGMPRRCVSFLILPFVRLVSNGIA